jgi:hypothetical protein
MQRIFPRWKRAAKARWSLTDPDSLVLDVVGGPLFEVGSSAFGQFLHRFRQRARFQIDPFHKGKIVWRSHLSTRSYGSQHPRALRMRDCCCRRSDPAGCPRDEYSFSALHRAPLDDSSVGGEVDKSNRSVVLKKFTCRACEEISQAPRGFAGQASWPGSSLRSTGSINHSTAKPSAMPAKAWI